MAGHGGFATEELGRPGDWHPRWCRRPHDGPHRSETFHAGPRTVYATADSGWGAVTVHRAGDGPLDRDEGLYLAAVIEYLSDPAGIGR